MKDEVYSAGFVNHGQRVKTYVEIAKKLGQPAYVGALQANFGNIYETGIADLQNQIQSLNDQIALNNQTIQSNLTSLSTLQANVETLNTQLGGLNTDLNTFTAQSNTVSAQINDLNTQLNNPELTEEQTATIQSQIDTQ